MLSKKIIDTLKENERIGGSYYCTWRKRFFKDKKSLKKYVVECIQDGLKKSEIKLTEIYKTVNDRHEKGYSLCLTSADIIQPNNLFVLLKLED